MLLTSLLIAAAVSGPGAQRPRDVPVVLGTLRGGADQPDDTEPELSSVSFSQIRGAHLERMAAFMEQTEAALQRARTTCKSGFVASLFGASSSANIVQRRDRIAMVEAFSLLSELYADSCTLASEEAWHAYVAASLRLHCCLHLLLAEEAVGIDLSFIAPETARALHGLREACKHKPKGTVAEVVHELRAALPSLAAGVLDLLHSALLSDETRASEGEARQNGQLQQQQQQQQQHLQQQLEGAVGELRQTQSEQQQQERAYEERCAMADQQMAALAQRVREAEMQLAAAHAATESEAARAAQASASALEAAVAQARAAAAAETRALEEQLEQHRLGAATLQQHVAHLAATLAGLEQNHAQLLSAHHSLEQYCQRAAQLEHQAQQRAHAHAQLVGEEYTTVAAGAHRELQLELQSVLQQHTMLQQQHAATLELLHQRQSEAQSAAAQTRTLTQRLELVETSRPPAAASSHTTERAPQGGGSGSSGSLLSGFAGKLRDKSRDLKELSLGLVADLSSTIQANRQVTPEAEQQQQRPDGERGA